MKYSYETHYRSHRPDGRIGASQAAEMERLRHTRPALSALKAPTHEAFLAWQKQIREKAKTILNMPPLHRAARPRSLVL
jgi:NAD-dependent DNA ligase